MDNFDFDEDYAIWIQTEDYHTLDNIKATEAARRALGFVLIDSLHSTEQGAADRLRQCPAGYKMTTVREMLEIHREYGYSRIWGKKDTDHIQVRGSCIPL
jgi:hypothetical protein